jgi:hypothetical protein
MFNDESAIGSFETKLQNINPFHQLVFDCVCCQPSGYPSYFTKRAQYHFLSHQFGHNCPCAYCFLNGFLQKSWCFETSK